MNIVNKKVIFDKVTLRTLTKESIVPDISRYKGMTIGSMLKNKPTVLVYMYFNYQYFTFTNEILDELGILERFRFQKPGINKELWERLHDYNKLDAKYYHKRITTAVIGGYAGAKSHRINTPDSKAKLRSKNQNPRGYSKI